MMLRRRQSTIATTAATLCAAILLTACGSSGTKTTTTTAHSTTTAAATANSVRMDMTITDSTQSVVEISQWTETDSIDGSYRTAQVDGSDDEAYDATSRTLYSHITASGHSALNIQANVALAAPDRPTRETDELAQYVESMEATSGGGVQQITRLGRPALELQTAITAPTLKFDHADIIVDQETGLPLLIDTTLAGKPYMKWDSTTFDARPDPSTVSYTITPTGSDDVNRTDAGFLDTQTNLVKSQVGYDSLAPSTIPAGFVISRVITHPSAGDSTGSAASNPQSAEVVQTMYKSGWQKFFITTRSSQASSMKWSDPFAVVTLEYVGSSRPITVATGALATARGEVVVSPAEAAHAWAAGTTLVATVSGPFSGDVLESAMNSLN